MNQRHGCSKLPPMATINRRITALIEGDFVVFIIGARLNRWWRLPKYLWFFSSMSKMLAEAAAKQVVVHALKHDRRGSVRS